MRIVYAAALLAAVSATPALAQEPATFTGGHIDLIGGIDVISAAGDSESGLAYGIAAGYDFGSAHGPIFGVELEATDSTAKECDDSTGVCIHASRDLYAGVRAGLPVSDNALIYAKAGYTNARAVAELGTVSDGTNLDGVRGGVGVEFRTDSPLLVRLEYRYSNYESDFSRHQVMAGLGFRF